MKIALLGYGKEGQAAEKYFETHFKHALLDIYADFTFDELLQKDYSFYDIILRSPSVPPLPDLPKLTSVTRYFFDHCPCPIIGVTATKGKGTTCSFVKSLLDAHGYDAHLVGNIGVPAISVLDSLTPSSVVVYEMSSFQLWDLPVSPHIAVVGMIEPDHLNVHRDFDDYLTAKSHIARFQTENDYCIYYAKNPDSAKIASFSNATKVPYPFNVSQDILDSITLPGAHNQDNAIAAIAAVAALKNISPDEYLRENISTIKQGLSHFHGLPHRLEFLRTVDGVRFYDDNFSTNVGSTKVAIASFPDDNVVMIVGGRDKTDNHDLPELYQALSAPQVKKVILIGESGHALYQKCPDDRFVLAESLSDAVTAAFAASQTFPAHETSTHETSAHKTSTTSKTSPTHKTPLSHKTAPDRKASPARAVVIMSPAAASFDMFKNVYDRGAKYQLEVQSLL